MYADPDAIRTLARRLRDQADDVRREADRLVGLLDATPWTGRAARAARARAVDRAGDLRACATRHDRAAEALERHAREVQRLQELIARIERVVAGLVADAVAEATGGAEHLWGRVRSFVAPPPGSPDWLDVDVRSFAAALTGGER